MKIHFAALIPVFFAVACGNDQPTGNGTDTLKKDSVKGVIEIPESNSDLPSPLRVAAMFKRSGLKYLPGLTNSDANAAKYSSTFVRAENMGVYSSDMAYSVMNKQTNEGTKYLKTIREIAGQINLGKVFEQGNLYDRFQKNLDNEDSLGSVIAEIQYQTDEQLEQNQQSDMYGIIFSGAWIEAMHIGGQVYEKDGNDNVVNALFEQMAVCKNIIEELKTYEPKNPSITPLLADLQGVEDAINSMPSMKKINADPDLSPGDVHPTKDEIDPVIKKIEDVRNKIING
ncbi:MAG: hypothetical protein HY064_12590 [Bacteroidetes bacterium]|nr:hypothetical protein [Bacteroidota bacterium]